jgi:hypothetical protein
LLSYELIRCSISGINPASFKPTQRFRYVTETASARELTAAATVQTPVTQCAVRATCMRDLHELT